MVHINAWNHFYIVIWFLLLFDLYFPCQFCHICIGIKSHIGLLRAISKISEVILFFVYLVHISAKDPWSANNEEKRSTTVRSFHFPFLFLGGASVLIRRGPRTLSCPRPLHWGTASLSSCQLPSPVADFSLLVLSLLLALIASCHSSSSKIPIF